MKRAQRGAALLVAMLTVTLVATFAAAAMWQQWRNAEVEDAERTRIQAGWVLTGALDWARLILGEDSVSIDHLSEPWAVPLEEARLSTFLAADRSGGDITGTDAENVFLSGSISDQQALLNLGSLVNKGSINEVGLRSFQRLFSLLGLPASELNRLAENMRFANDIATDNQSASQASLAPQRFDQIPWLGVSPATVSALRPYVTLLPINTPVNVNTAPAEVLYAVIDSLTLADAQELVALRAATPFRTTSDILKKVPKLPPGVALDVKSQFFEVRGRLRLDQLVLEERSLVQRLGPRQVQTLWRERTAPQLAAASTTTSR